MNRTILLILVITVGLLSSCCGCRSAKSNNPYNLFSNGWKLVEMNREKVASEGNAYSLTFTESDKSVKGVGDCNNFFSDFTLIGVNGLTIDGGGSTRMFCPNQTQEDEYLKTLNSVDSYSVDGDTLLLIKDGEVVLIFSPLT